MFLILSETKAKIEINTETKCVSFLKLHILYKFQKYRLGTTKFSAPLIITATIGLIS